MRSKPFKLIFSVDCIRRWDVIKSGIHSQGIVTEKNKYKGATTLTVRPYNPPKNKWLRLLKFIWLKIQVHYS